MKPWTRALWSGADHRADVGGAVPRVADDHLVERRGAGLEELVVLLLVHQQPGERGAALAAVAGPAQVHLDGDLGDVDVVGDDARRLAAELEGDAGEVLGGLGHDLGAHAVGAGERDPVDAAVRGQLLADLDAADDHVHDARREPRLLDQVTEQERGERRARRREQHDRAAGREGRAELEDREVQRVVVAGDRGDHADRLVDDVALGRVRLVVAAEVHGAVDLGGLGRPAQVLVDGHLDLEVLRQRDGRADLVDDRGQQPVGGRLEHVGEPVDVARALLAGQRGPRGERLAGRVDGGVDLRGGRPADGRDDLLGGRVVDVPALALGVDHPVPDEQGAGRRHPGPHLLGGELGIGADGHQWLLSVVLS